MKTLKTASDGVAGMQNKKIKIIFIVFLLFANITIFADRKSSDEVESEIAHAEKMIKKTEALKPVKEFPYELVLAKYYLEKAKENLDDGDEDIASYFAVLSAIQGETAYYKLQAFDLKWKRKEEELKLWKSLAAENSGEMAKVYHKMEKEIRQTKLDFAVINAGFENADNVFSMMLKDSENLIKITFSIKDSGKIALSEWFQILALIPGIQLKIESHTSGKDKDNLLSTAKGEALKTYLIQSGLFKPDQIVLNAYGNEKPLMNQDKPVKGKANDRIEIFFEKEKSYHFIFQDAQIIKKQKKDFIFNGSGMILLNEFLAIFLLLPDPSLLIEGHTSNKDLENSSLAKAVLMKDYFIQKTGFAPDKIKTTGFGDTKPLMNGSKPVKGKNNDRMVLSILVKDKIVSLLLKDSEMIQKGGFSARISEEGKKNLNELVQMIKNNAVEKARINIEGFTDKYDKNNSESELKANLIRDYLVENGKIPVEKTTLYPLGNKKPLKVDGKVLKGVDNNRVEVSFAVGKKYLLGIHDNDLFIKKSFLISESGKSYLDKVHYLLSLIPNAKILIEGHTSGNDKNNSVSESKASAIRDYFVNVKKVSDGSISVKAYGNLKPIEINGVEKKGALNDRVVIIIELPKSEAEK